MRLSVMLRLGLMVVLILALLLLARTEMDFVYAKF
jgi:hypothetical protein